MKTLFILGVFIYWCWAGHGGLVTVGGAMHSISAVLGLATHSAAHLCAAAPQACGVGRAACGAVALPLGSHWNGAAPRLQLSA